MWMFLLIIPACFVIYFLAKHNVTQTEWFIYGLLKNQWLWFHMLASLIGTKIMMLWMNTNTIIFVVALLAIGWEAIEWHFSSKHGTSAYSNFMHYVWDTVFDIVMSVLVAVICVI